MNFRAGDKVTCKIAINAYYSSYGIKPKMVFKPGMVGYVVSMAPKVFKLKRGIKNSRFDHKEFFLVIDYIAPETGKLERVGLDYCNTKAL